MPNTVKRTIIALALLGEVLFSFVLFPAERPAVQQLESRLETLTGEKRLELLPELARAYQDVDPGKALTYGKECLELLDRYPNPQLRVDVLNDLCEACNSLGLYDSSRDYARQAKEIARETGYNKGYADSLFHMGRVNYYQGIYDKASTFLAQAREIYAVTGNETGIAQTKNAFGLVYWKLGDYSRALELILESCKIRERQQGKSAEADRDIAYSYNNIGLIYVEVGDYDKSREYLLKAKQIHQSIGNRNGLAIALNNLASIYRDRGEYEKALDYYKQSLEIKEDIGYKHGAAITTNNIGKVYERMEDYPKALDYLGKGLAISAEINQQNAISNTLITIGRIKRKIGQYQDALNDVNRGLEIALKLGIRAEIRGAYEELAEIYSLLGDFPKTLFYLKKYKEFKDLVFNETSSLKIAELQTRYDMEKNEKEIALLKKNNAIHQLLLERRRIFNYFIVIILVLVSIGGVVIFNRYRLKLKLSRALSREIDEHKLTTQKLLENEEKFRILAESAIVGIYILQENRVKYVNPGFLSIFHCREQDVLGKNFPEFILEEDRPAVMEKLEQRNRNSDNAVCYEFRIMNKQGEILHLESYGGLIRYQGHPAILETVVDITKRHKSADQLLKSKKLEAMGILTGGIAHDFNNLLAVLVGYLEMVKDEIPPGTPAEELAIDIEKSYNQAVELGKKLASFAKGGWINPKEVTIRAILDKTFNDFPQIAALLDTISIPDDIWPVFADERQLKQVLIYLMRYSENVTIIEKSSDTLNKPLGIRAENIFLQEDNEFLLDRGKYVRVIFTDSSRIIPQEELEKVFEPSFSTTPSPTWKAMGLEMAMCHSIIKKHNGNISVTADPANGTVFDFILPAYHPKIGKSKP